MNNVLVSTVFSSRGGGLSSHVGDLVTCLQRSGNMVKRIDFDQARISQLRKLFCALEAFGNMDRCRKYMTKARVNNLRSAIASACKSTDFNLIHCHDPIASYAARLVKPAGEIPLVQTIHGPYSFESQIWVNKDRNESEFVSCIWEIEKQSFQEADRLIAVDTGQAKYAQEEFGIDASKIDIIFNAVDSEDIRKIACEEPDFEVPARYIFVPRRHVSKNGVDIAIQAMSYLKDKADLKLVSAGGGPETDNLKKMVEQLGLEDRVIFLGMRSRNETLKWVKRAQAVLIPSKPSWGVVEATSIAAIEAMACGSPLVVSNIGGLAELVKDNYNGLTVLPGEPEILSVAIRRLLDDDELRQTLCLRAQEHVRDNLDVKVWFKKVLNVYAKAGVVIDR